MTYCTLQLLITYIYAQPPTTYNQLKSDFILKKIQIAREEVKKKKSIQLALNALFLFCDLVRIKDPSSLRIPKAKPKIKG